MNETKYFSAYIVSKKDTTDKVEQYIKTESERMARSYGIDSKFLYKKMSSVIPKIKKQKGLTTAIKERVDNSLIALVESCF